MATFAPTPLVENSNVIVQVPQGFNVQMAWLLAQCSNLTYTQYDLGPGQLPDFSSLQMGSANNKITTSNPVAFNVSEAAGSGAIPGDVGDYYPAAAGFAVTITQSNPAPGTPATFIVIALRGTRTWTEWMDDVEAVPIGFDGTFNGAITYGAVHAGILGLLHHRHQWRELWQQWMDDREQPAYRISGSADCKLCRRAFLSTEHLRHRAQPGRSAGFNLRLRSGAQFQPILLQPHHV